MTGIAASYSGFPSADALYHQHQRNIFEHTDRLFAGLMCVQWVAAIAAAYWVSPRAWSGTASQVHVHVWAAICLGGAISLFPIALALTRPGRASTRYVIAAAQMLMSSLLIHFTGGRIETHFHVFGSLAFLSFYRDWKVLVPATLVVAADHFLRGVWWPESVFGVLTASNWRWLEHAGWVVFEDVFLIGACRRAQQEMHDIADRTAQLHASDDRYRAIVDRAEGIFLFDAETTAVLECNAAFRTLLGVDGKDVTSLTLYEIDAGSADEIGAAIRQLREQRVPVEAHRQYRRSDGAVLDVTLNMSLLAHGARDVVCGAVRDVTAHKRAEQELRENEVRKAAIVEAAFDCIIMIDGQGCITEFNRAAEQTFGCSRAHALGRNFVELIIPPDDRGKDHAEFAGYLQVGTTAMIGDRIEVLAGRCDGSTFPAELTFARIEAGGAPTFTCFLRDITGRKQSEQALRDSEAQLRQAQKMEAVGQLAGGVAHDFNNLLTGILGYSELTLEQLGPDHPATGDVSEIVRAGKSAAALTRQLLTFSRRQVAHREILDVNAALSGVHKLLHRLIGEQIELVTTTDPALACIEADAGQIEQVIVNLAVNARDAMPQGGRLTLETANVTVTARGPNYGLGAGRYVMLLVGDTGCGMDAHVQAHLFEPFFSTKDPGKGTGLGLATVYGIVKQSGGSIAIESAPGDGSTFRIFLPALEGVAPNVQPRAVEGPVVHHAKTILLVEDDSIVRGLAKRTLQNDGYVVLEASGPGEAIRIAARHGAAIHLVLSDVVMPEMSGPALVSRLRIEYPDAGVLFMSGYTDDALAPHDIRDGNAAFLPKPFTPTELMRCVSATLARPAMGSSRTPAAR